MKMETSISAPSAGTIVDVLVKSGDSCVVGDALVTLG
jgi:biotin carboxyl carrier protein